MNNIVTQENVFRHLQNSSQYLVVYCYVLDTQQQMSQQQEESFQPREFQSTNHQETIQILDEPNFETMLCQVQQQYEQEYEYNQDEPQNEYDQLAADLTLLNNEQSNMIHMDDSLGTFYFESPVSSRPSTPTPADYFMNYKRQECNNFNNETIGVTEPENEFTDYEYICNFINCLDEEI